MQLARVTSVSRSGEYSFTKEVVDEIRLVEGLGIDGDVHAGVTVKHRSRVRQDPSQPNLRQVHLLHSELFEELRAKGFDLTPGLIGENVTTAGIDLLGLPTGTLLRIGADAVVEVTGLRNPCSQLDDLQPGLLAAVLDKGEDGALIRKARIMGIVLEGGVVRAGDRIERTHPTPPWRPLERV